MEVLEERVSILEDMIKDILYIQQQNAIGIKELQKAIQISIERVDRERQEREKQHKEWLERFERERQEWNRKIEEERRQREQEHKEWLEKLERERQEKEEQRKKDWEEWNRKLEEEKKRREEERKQDIREWNKKWGELSNKLGTIVEDIIFPATEPVLMSYFKCELNDLFMNHKRKRGELKDEFDVVAISDECKAIFLIEVKATPKVEYINEFKDKKIDRFRKLAPEYAEYKIIPIFASLRLPEDIVNYLTKQNIYAMAYREWEYMDILNFEQLNQKEVRQDECAG